jgi:hypothetical protein
MHSEIAWQAAQDLLELQSSASENKANETHHFSDRDADFIDFGLGRYEDARHKIYTSIKVVQFTTNIFMSQPVTTNIVDKLLDTSSSLLSRSR